MRRQNSPRASHRPSLKDVRYGTTLYERHTPGTVEDEEPHARAEGGREEFMLEAGEMRVEAWALSAPSQCDTYG